MSQPDAPRQVEVKEGDDTVAAAQVSRRPGGTARASLHPASGPAGPGTRASLVDAVVATPEVQQSSRLEATVPLGDGEALDRLRERTEDTSTRPAGSTALVDATVPRAQPPGGQPPEAEPPEGEPPEGEPPEGEPPE